MNKMISGDVARRAISRRRLRLLAFGSAFAGIALAVLLSPLLIAGLARLSMGAQWETLSYIGQTYGAIAAILTAFSLMALVWSIRLQAQGLTIQTEQVARAHYIDLVSLALQDPRLGAGSPWGADIDLATTYSGLWLAHWRGLFVLGYMPEAELRLEISGLFAVSPSARERWARGREYFRAGNPLGAGRRFFDIVDEAYEATATDLSDRADPEGAGTVGRQD